VVFAVGDVHGRAELLDALIDEIGRDAERSAEEGKTTSVIFLGDYIDRGPASRQVIDRLIALGEEKRFESVFLRGNHEQFLLDVIDGRAPSAIWLDYGGTQTLAAYGVETDEDSKTDDLAQLGVATRKAVPLDHVAFMRGLGLTETRGDYLFVHAGLRPDRMLSEQADADFLWYRSYSDEAPVHGKVVVHGHTPHSRPVNGRWRVDVDTEAWASGILTAIRLEGQSRRFLRAEIAENGAGVVSDWEQVDRAHHRPDVSAAHDATARQKHVSRVRRQSSGFWSAIFPRPGS
jgi:serine/threonine protein phosphatase 1